MINIEKARRETIRWFILVTLNTARPIGAFEAMILSVIQAEFPNATRDELRRELDYLSGRELVKLDKQPDGRWHSQLTRYGTDLVEYTIDCEPGINRPEKY